MVGEGHLVLQLKKSFPCKSCPLYLGGFFFALSCIASTFSWGFTKDDLVYRDGLFYKKFTDTPFTGQIEGRWNGSLSEGKKEGYWIYYHENGQLSGKGNYKDGKKHGCWEGYLINGIPRQGLTGNFYEDEKTNVDFCDLISEKN